MAYFRTMIAFDATAFDLHAPLSANATSVSHLIGTAKHPLGIAVTDGGWLPGYRPITIPLFSLTFPEAVQIGTKTSPLSETAYGADLAPDSTGLPNGGVVQMLRLQSFGVTDWTLAGLSIAGADFSAAVTSHGTQDDRVLWAAAMSGNDHIILSGFADRINAGEGRDLVFGGNGNDTLAGGNGNDLIDAMADNDWLDAGGGNDVVFGGNGRDTVLGGLGADTLGGGGGVDHLTGDRGADCFVFSIAEGTGLTVVTDYTVGVDHLTTIGVNKFTLPLGFEDLHLQQGAQGAVLRYLDANTGEVTRMLLLGVRSAEIGAADFSPAPYATSTAQWKAAYDGFTLDWHYMP